jgi:YfiH family protein
MLKKHSQGYYYLEGLSRQQRLVHGFSSRRFGDCNPLRSPEKTWPNVEEFLKAMGLKRQDLSVMEQVHGRRIKVINRDNLQEIIPEVDGLLTQEKGIVLGIHTADCLPIFYFDSRAGLVGVAHAGWRGVFKEIPRKMIELMITRGSLPERVIIGIGPFIGPCCYEIKRDVADKFLRKFGPVKGMIVTKGKKYFLDMAVLARFQLIGVGVLGKNIEFAGACTACRNQEFFSKRKDRPETYGGILGVISLK